MFKVGQKVCAEFLEFFFESEILDKVGTQNYLILVPNSFSDMYCVWDQFPSGVAGCVKQQNKLAYFHELRLKAI